MPNVRLTKNGNDAGVAIPPSAFTTDLSPDGEKTWEEAGYKLDSHEADRTPYVLTDADRQRVADAKEKRAAARAAAEPKAEAPAKADKGK